MSKSATTQTAQKAPVALTAAPSGILQRKCACGNHTVAGGECAECGKEKTLLQRKALDQRRVSRPPIIQTKLIVGSSSDPLEQEADRIADQVMSTSSHSVVSGTPLRIQRFSGHSAADAVTAPASVDRVLASSGRPLEPALRHDMEQRFGHDFSRVSVHTDHEAATTARQVGAIAYTVGHQIVFDSGRFAPETPRGRRLLAHELSHTIQQGAALPRQAGERMVHTKLRPTLQRSMGFEFQTDNIVTTNTGRQFPRKFPNKKAGLGQFFHKGKTGVELQTDNGSVMEFETDPFRTWSDLKARIQEAVDIVAEIKRDPKKFPFNQEKAFKDKKLLPTGEKLVVDIRDSTFIAHIQSTEGLALSQYESLLKEHEVRIPAKFVDPVIKDAQDILDTVKMANPSITTNTDNLRGLLQMIINYLRRAREIPADLTDPEVVKAHFRLMHRTSFSSMFSDLLTKDEKTLFKEIVKTNAISSKFGLSATDPVFASGYWGHIGNMKALFSRGKIVVLATEDEKTFHNCADKKKTPGIDTTKCKLSFPDSDITVGKWLTSIVSRKKDLLSHPASGSESMGKLQVARKGEEKGLAIIETRGYQSRPTRSQPVTKWLDFAEDVFQQAAMCRPRPGTGTELIYDGGKAFDAKKCA